MSVFWAKADISCSKKLFTNQRRTLVVPARTDHDADQQASAKSLCACPSDGTIIRGGNGFPQCDAADQSVIFLDASHCRYAPKPIRTTPPTNATPQISVSQNISSITK